MDFTTLKIPHFSEVVQPYLDTGNRDYLAKVLKHWSLAVDPDRNIGYALHESIFRDDEAAVRMILDAGVDPGLRQMHDPSFTPLLAAAQHGRLEIARLLWQIVGPAGRLYPGKRSTLSCLQVAARNGHADLVAYFLEVYADWTVDEEQRTLEDAAFSWCDDVVALLLARIDFEPSALQAALELVAQGRMILPEAPTRRPPRTEDYVHQQNVVRQLIDAGANPEVRRRQYFNQPLIHMASTIRYSIGALRGLLEGGVNVDTQDSEGRTALKRVVSRPPLLTDVLRVLLQHGASLEMVGEAGESVFHTIAHNGTTEQLQLCLSYSPNSLASIRSQTSTGETLLHYAAAGGREDIVEFLLDQDLGVNSATSNGWTPLLCALSPTNFKREQCAYRVAELLLQKGASAQVVTDEGWSPLHALATWPTARDEETRNWATRLAQDLISRGAPVDAEPRLIRDPSIDMSKLRDMWGLRMERFVEDLQPVTQSSWDMSDDTTPLMWAMRSNAIGVFETIRTHLDSGQYFTNCYTTRGNLYSQRDSNFTFMTLAINAEAPIISEGIIGPSVGQDISSDNDESRSAYPILTRTTRPRWIRLSAPVFLIQLQLQRNPHGKIHLTNCGAGGGGGEAANLPPIDPDSDKQTGKLDSGCPGVDSGEICLPIKPRVLTS